MPRKVGFIGLGAMGGPMALNLRRHRYRDRRLSAAPFATVAQPMTKGRMTWRHTC